MASRKDKRAARKKRHRRVRGKVFGTPDRPRLCVFRSANNMYAQVIDDVAGETLASASTLLDEVKEKCSNTGNKEAAGYVGELVAKRALDKGITKVVFDRAGYKYHGRVKALADSARENGLDF